MRRAAEGRRRPHRLPLCHDPNNTGSGQMTLGRAHLSSSADRFPRALDTRASFDGHFAGPPRASGLAQAPLLALSGITPFRLHCGGYIRTRVLDRELVSGVPTDGGDHRGEDENVGLDRMVCPAMSMGTATGRTVRFDPQLVQRCVGPAHTGESRL